MTALVAWANRAEREGLPAPLIAALTLPIRHYPPLLRWQRAHGPPAGNLHPAPGGYGLHGFFSLEEHHARDLAGYYGGLATHPHHNYYAGRAEADLTGWLEYFVKTLAGVFAAAQEEAERYVGQDVVRTLSEPEGLRRLDHRARAVLALFAGAETITATQVAGALGLSERTARLVLHEYVTDGWLRIANPSNRRRAYLLSASYRQYIGELSA